MSPKYPAFLPPLTYSKFTPRTSTNGLVSRHTSQIPKITASAHNYTTLLIIPTGIGASIGGYAGDALPTARLLSAVSDTLITHPNVLNGALMYWPIPNAHYVEGFALDQFCCGRINLQPLTKRSNKIGLLLDAAMDDTARIRHLQAADAARATLGLQIHKYTVTDLPIGVSYSKSPNGASWGTVLRPHALLEAARRLRDAGCDVIAVVAEFPEEDSEHLAEYRAGNAVDGIAGAEAVISHLITRDLQIPCAHAPSLAPLSADDSVHPKAAAEELGYTFLSCVLVGLSRAPKLLPASESKGLFRPGTLRAEDVDVVVVPACAFGGAGIMQIGAREDTLVIAVKDNRTVVDVSPGEVGIDEKRVVTVASYAEAAGIIAAHRAGIDLSSLTAQVPSLSKAYV